MFRLLYIASWLGLAAVALRALLAARDVITALGNGSLQPQQMSVWQLGIIPFTLMGLLMLLINTSHFRVHTPSRTHWRLLIGMWIMLLWLWFFSSRSQL